MADFAKHAARTAPGRRRLRGALPGICQRLTSCAVILLVAAPVAMGASGPVKSAPVMAGHVAPAGGTSAATERFTQIIVPEASKALLATPPHRIVSINLCADELALRLAKPATLKSVSSLARINIGSNVSELTRDIPDNYGTVEELMALKPDLIVAGRFTTRNTVALLRRLGVNVVDLDVPTSIAGVREQIREAGALFHSQDKTEAVLRDFDARLRAVDAGGAKPSAVVLRTAGFTTGEGSLLDDVLKHAGMTNLVGSGPLAGYEQLPLEFVLEAKPDILILAGDPLAPPSLATGILDHPALKRLKDHTMVVVLPSRLWTCAGPGVADAVALLAGAVAEWRAAKRQARPMAMGNVP